MIPVIASLPRRRVAPPGSQQVFLFSDPASWGGSVPTTGQDFEIPVGTIFKMDIANTPAYGFITVSGKVIADDTKDTVITFKGMTVMSGGKWEMGTVATPISAHTHRHIMNAPLSGAGKTSRANGGFSNTDASQRGIMVMPGGGIGVEALLPGGALFTKTKLAAHLSAGATTATTRNSTGWPSGSNVLVAPTQYFADSVAETVTLASAASGTTLTLNSGVVDDRWGLMQYINQTADTTTAQAMVVENGAMGLTNTGFTPANSNTPTSLDESATLLLMDRLVTFEGANDSDWTGSGFGAHMMVMGRTSFCQISGAAFIRCGQQDMQGRYPFHWHNLSYNTTDGTFLGLAQNNQYIKKCVVTGSSNRGITIHGTCGVTVQENVLYDIRGQGLFMEDGVEVLNTIDNNFTCLTKRTTGGGIAGQGLKAFETTDATGAWLTNAYNYVTNNEHCGHNGPGSWFSLAMSAFGDNANAFDIINTMAATYVSATSFTIVGNFTTSSFTFWNGSGKRLGLQLTSGWVANTIASSSYSSGTNLTTIVLNTSNLDATLTFVAAPIIPRYMPILMAGSFSAFSGNYSHANSETGHRLELSVTNEQGTTGSKFNIPTLIGGAESHVFGSFGGGIIASPFDNQINCKNAGGGYVNRVGLAFYTRWISSGNSGLGFFGTHEVDTGGLIKASLFVASSLNTAGTMPYTVPQGAVTSYHSSNVTQDCVSIGFNTSLTGSPDTTHQPNGLLISGHSEAWDFYTRPEDHYDADNGTGNQYLSSHPMRLMESPPYDSLGPIKDDTQTSLILDFHQATNGSGTPDTWGILSGAKGTPGTFFRGWLSSPADATRMAKFAYGIRSVTCKASEGGAGAAVGFDYIECRKINSTDSDARIGFSLTDYSGQGGTRNQMDYGAVVLTDGTVKIWNTTGADTAMGTPYQFTSFVSNNVVRLARNCSTGSVTVQVSIAGAGFVTKHTFGTTTTADLHRYIGCAYSGNVANDGVRSPAGSQHQFRIWQLVSAFKNGTEVRGTGKWGGTPGQYIVPNLTYFTYGNTVAAVPVGSMPNHRITSQIYCGAQLTMSEFAEGEHLETSWKVDIERNEPSTKAVQGHWYVSHAFETSWTAFFHWSMQQGGMYTLRFPDNPPANRPSVSGKTIWRNNGSGSIVAVTPTYRWNVQYKILYWNGGSTIDQIVGVEFPGAAATCSVYSCASGFQQTTGAPTSGQLSANIAMQASSVASFAALQAATTFSYWFDTANDLVYIKQSGFLSSTVQQDSVGTLNIVPISVVS